MPKRNFILLIIILGIIIIGVFVFFYFQKTPSAPTDNGEGTNFNIPFGSTTKPPTPTPPADVSEYEPGENIESENLKLAKVSSMPVAGFTVFSKERMKEIAPVASLPVLEEKSAAASTAKKPAKPLTEFVSAARYTAKADGNIYQTFLDKIQERRFSKTVIPKIYDSYFGNHGESVVMRYLKEDGRTIETFMGSLPKELLGAEATGNNEVKGYFLPNDIKDISVSPDGQKIFYLFESEGASGNDMVGTILNLLNNKRVQIFDSPFSEWLSQWPNNNTIALSTKPSSVASGYMYTIDSAGKNLIKVLGDINGLSILEAINGKLILYGDSNLSLNIYHAETRNSDILGVKTLPEKCVWNKESDVVYCAVPKLVTLGQYPDAWYQGEVSFNDQFWKIDVKTGNANLLIDPAKVKGGEEIDGIKLSVDEGENYLSFINKKDSFLWKLDLR